MPVLRQHHVVEALGDSVDYRDDLIAVLHRQAAARQEAVLYVDDQQQTGRSGFDLVRGERRAHR
jgi:hypothetical protein